MNKVIKIVFLVLISSNSFSQKRVAFGIKFGPNFSFAKNEYRYSKNINSRPRIGAGLGIFFNHFLGFENKYFWGIEAEYITKSYSVNYKFSKNQIGKFVSGYSNPYLRFNVGRNFYTLNKIFTTIVGISTDFYRLEGLYEYNDSIVNLKKYSFQNRSVNLSLEIGLSKPNSRWNYSFGYSQGLVLIDRIYVTDFFTNKPLLSTKYRGSCLMIAIRYNLLKAKT